MKLENGNDEDSNKNEKKYYATIILDCTLIRFIDETGAKCLKDIIRDYKKEKVEFLLTNCNGLV